MTAVEPERAWGTVADPSRPHQIKLRSTGSVVTCSCNCGMTATVVDTTIEDECWRVYAQHLTVEMINDWVCSDYARLWDYLGLPQRLYFSWLNGDL